MANQGIGNFLGSFADTFTRGMQNNAEQKRLNEMAKLQGKLVELELQARETQQNAQTQVSEMMSGDPSLIGASSGGREMITPRLGTPGESVSNIGRTDPRPMTAEQLVNDPQGLSALLASGQLEGVLGLAQEKRLQSRLDQEAEIFNTMSGMFGGSGSDSAAAVHGGEPEYLQQFQINSDGTSSVVMSPNPRYTSPVEKASAGIDLQSQFQEAGTVIDLMEDLENTWLRSGNPIGDFWEAGESALVTFLPQIMSNPEQRKVLLDKRQKVRKGLADLVISGPEIEILQKGGRLTVTALEQLKKASADLKNGWRVNSKIILDSLEYRVLNADLLGTPVQNPQQVLQWIEQQRARISTPATQGGDQQENNRSFFDVVSSGLSNATDQAGALANQAGGFATDTALPAAQDLGAQGLAAAQQGIETATPIVQEAAAQTQQFAKMSLDKLQQIDFKALAGDAKEEALIRWDQLVSKMPIEEIEKMDLVGKTEEQLLSIELQYRALIRLRQQAKENAK